MSSQLPSRNPTAYLGTRSTNPGQVYFKTHDPVSTVDFRPYYPGDWWINTASNSVWNLVKKTTTSGTWVGFSGGSGDIEQITPSTGAAIIPTGNNVNILGDAASGVDTTNTASDTITISIDDATTTSKGVSEYDASLFTVTAGDVTIKDCSTTTKGVAEFDPTYFSVTAGVATLNVPVAITAGGTNAGSFSTSTGIVKYDGTRLVSSTTATLDSSNRYVNTAQPIFTALAPLQTNATGDNTDYTVQFTTVTKNVGGAFDGTSTFTAPVTGNYSFNYVITTNGYLAANTAYNVAFKVNMTDVDMIFCNPFVCSSGGVLRTSGSQIFSLNATDTVIVLLTVSNGTKVINVTDGRFQGYLLF